MSTNEVTNDKVNIVPLPPDLINLPTIEAEPWFQIDPGTVTFLEGPVFDREDNLFVTYPQAGKVFRITPRQQMRVIFDDEKTHSPPAGTGKGTAGWIANYRRHQKKNIITDYRSPLPGISGPTKF